jgi:repressor LexA
MSEIQNRVFEFVCNEILVHHCPPTIVEIQRHFGWKSPNAAEEHVERLVKAGKLTRLKRGPRNIRLPEAPQVAA